MKNKFFYLPVILAIVFISNIICVPVTSSATIYDLNGEEHHLTIATTDTRPLAVDRLLYWAFKRIDYQASFSTTFAETGYDMANTGERDGAISSAPNLELKYTNLRKVPMPLETTLLRAVVLKDSYYSQLEVNDWGDLSGCRVGIITKMSYVSSQIPDDAVIIEADTSTQLFDSLLKDKIDIAVVLNRVHEEFSLPSDIVSISILEELTDYLYLHKDHEYLIPMISKSIENAFADGSADNILNDIPVANLNSTKTVLHIISHHTEIIKEEKFTVALRERFKSDDDDLVEWYSMSFNSRRSSMDPARMVYFAQILRQDCVSRNIAAIVVSGGDALEFIKEYYYLFFRNVPVIFYGAGSNYSEMIIGYEDNFAGITERLSASETLSVSLDLFPNTKNIYVINDYSTEGREHRTAIEEQLKSFEDILNIEYNKNVDFKTLLEQVKELPPDTAVIVGSYFRDAAGQYISYNEMGKALKDNCSVPIFTLYSSDLGYNAIGGKCADYEKYGTATANMLMQILGGTSVESISVINTDEYNRWTFDNNLLNKWGIKEKLLPAGSQILNKPLSIWETDFRFAVTLLLTSVLGIIITIVITVLFYKYNKQREHLQTTQELLNKDEKIKEVKERLERIINTAPIAYMMTASNKVIEANEYIRKYLDIKEDDDPVKLYTEPQAREKLSILASKQGIVTNEIVKYNMSNGEVHRFLTNIGSIEYEGKTAYMLWGVDIEKNESQKDQLDETQRSLRTMIDTMPIPVSIATVDDMQIVYGNKRYFNLLEYDPSEEINLNYIQNIVYGMKEITGSASELFKHIVGTGETAVKEIQISTAKGNIIDVRLITSVINYNNKKSVLGIITDLTAEKEYERMLLSTAEKEKEANQLKSRFLVNMSHEIRTPMNAIIGLTEIELRKEAASEIKEIYHKINTSAKNLLNIVNDILDLSKIEADKIELFIEEFELEDVISSALLVASPRLDGKNVEFMLNASLNLPRFIMGDRTRLWQILKNFLDNSAKYTENGRIVLTVFSDDEKSDNETIYINFVIEDTGIGMSEEQMERLFVPYMQIYNEAQKRYTGTGLGMAISKQLCELMGGTMQVESRKGKGTIIYLGIPFKRSKNSETELQSVNNSKLVGVNILAVDDDELSLSIMAELIAGSSANYTLARNGEEAIKIIFEGREKGVTFDLILLDYMMDGLNGLETAKYIQAGLSVSPKLLMVTSYQRLLLKRELQRNNIAGVIEKPFIPSQFINKLCVALGGANNDHSILTDDGFVKFKDTQVLICEDYRLNQEVAIGMLVQFGISCVIAEDGSKGVEILKNSDNQFDLVFMDLQMPVMDGYEATRIIRADSKFDKIPIISLTADAMLEVVDKCMATGMNDHLSKPIEFDKLNEILVKWLPVSKRIRKEDESKGESKSENTDSRKSKTTAVNRNKAKEMALARFGGKKDLYEKSLREFIKDLPAQWADFDEAVSRANLDATQKYVHKIKGASGNLGETDIYNCAVDFEASVKNGSPCRELYTQLVATCGRAKAVLDKADAEKASVSEPPADTLMETGTHDELNNYMEMLENALNDYDLKRSASAVAMLKSKVWQNIDQIKLELLYNYIQDYNYDAAINILCLLREEVNKQSH